MAYTIEELKHGFAAWAAARAAGRGVKGLKGKRGRSLLDGLGFADLIDAPDRLPRPDKIDEQHRNWREQILQAAPDLNLSHGIAAKLINVYLKSAFVCGGFAEHPNVRALHPPIDRLILDRLAMKDIGGLKRRWRRYHKHGWKSFDSDVYEAVIADVKTVQGNLPLWMIEEHWRGYQ
jgi:hypothetical protein